MDRSDRCDGLGDLIAELALEVADGEDRARVLEHTADCTGCRLELERLAAVSDELLTLAPEHEPPIGFELRALRTIQPNPIRRRQRVRQRLALVAAVVAAAAVTAGGMLFAFRDERDLAAHYRATLAEADGRYFASVAFRDAFGQRGGVLFEYGGNLSWIMVTVDEAHRVGIERAQLVTTDDRTIPLEDFRLSGGAWGGSIPIRLRDLARVQLLGADGQVRLVASP